MSNVNERINQNENVFAGIVGSFLFSLAGGIVWFILWQINILAAISGIVGVVCAIKGYAIFAKKESIKGIIISIVMSLIVIVIAWYFCLAMDVYNQFKVWYEEGSVGYTLTFGESVRNAYLFLEDSEGYISDLLIGILFCVIGGIGYVSTALKRVKAQKAATAQSGTVVEETPAQEAPTRPVYNGEPEYRPEDNQQF